MKKKLSYPVCVLMVVLGLMGCKKNDGSGTGGCRLLGETITYTILKEFWKYEYDEKGNPKECLKLDSTGLLVGDVTISAQRVVTWNWITRTTDTTDYMGDIFSGIPKQSKVTEVWDGRPPTDEGSYTFSYDSKNQVTYVDGTYAKVQITYDDRGNVTQILYTYSQGTTTVNVMDYDNKLSPYHSVMKSWKFIQHHADWANPEDPQPLVSVLSKNNPLKISIVQNNVLYSYLTGTEVIVYSYNEHNLPSESSVTFIHSGTAPRLNQKYLFTYDCQ